MKAVLFALWLVATPFDGDIAAWAQWGLAGLVVGFTSWRDWQREQRLGDMLSAQQDWIRDKLLAALERNTAALERLSICCGERQCDQR